MPILSSLGQRIVVVGPPGAGKTTLAQELGVLLHLPPIEVDALYWGPGWTPQDPDVARSALLRHLASDGWVLDGTYRRYWPLTWTQADTLIWLDYARGRLFWRLLRRTLPRIITHQQLWHGNTETWRGAFVDSDNLFRQAWHSQPRLRRLIPEALLEPCYAHLKIVHLRSPKQTRDWLATVEPTPSS